MEFKKGQRWMWPSCKQIVEIIEVYSGSSSEHRLCKCKVVQKRTDGSMDYPVGHVSEWTLGESSSCVYLKGQDAMSC